LDKEMELEGKVALITGGAQGIGRVISEELARQGAHVILGDVNLEGAEKTAAELKQNGAKASAVRIDVSSSSDVQSAFDSIIKEYKPVDIVVNNAGITRDGLLVRMKEADWDLVMNINLKGCFLCSQQAAKQMMKQKSGTILNIASIVGLIGNFGQANYSASKAGLIGFTKTLAREVAPRGIRANAIAPGFIDTEMTRVLEESVREKLIEQIPLARLGKPEDVARCVSFLVSEKASYITGQVISVNGGMLM
jgi:3-oxoacyl-[acyl-carrier protein] reductase